MHTRIIDGCTFNFDNDFTGVVEITDRQGQKIWIGMSTLCEFVAAFVRDSRVSQLQCADWRDVLGLKSPS